ncbi:GNAT family N-acetyltransferase [Natronomonas salsuginis]|jgi:ribosomal protein S18 acetylase RimI-like enzyme|uniref:GNAT family N-acetyltransferase n=1 Tax=Natronomonas salsuginis TaxID=2217661 RepID=A0A4U5JIP4_9EURY|nr:GNAT family N-acetyltransferase [Natronomonas salsuginis]TKR28231.1 GNAT family N-acetyltransferase [Natronomonas salsuginis]
MIRPLEPADRPTVRALQSHLQYADPDCIDAAVRGPFLGRVAVACDWLVGYALAFPGDPATLTELVVAPDARREGHGRELVESVVSAIDTDRIVVTTPTGNRGVRRFYRRLGFECDATCDGFYADGADALRLARRE